MRPLLVAVVVVLSIIALVLPQVFFTVDETQQAIVTQFGVFIREERTPGLKTKLPFAQSVVLFEKRYLRFDSPPLSLITGDKKNLIMDAYARYRIVNPLLAFQTIGDEVGANAKLGDIISSELKKQVASHSQSDIIAKTRAQLVDEVARISAEKALPFGIQLIDVRIKRADFPEEIASSIYARMSAERQREAAKFRSEGSEEEFKVKAEADRQKTVILADAKRDAAKIIGEGEAEAVRIFAEALQKDPEFYAFQRSLEAYRQFLVSNSTVVLSVDSDLFRYLDNPSGSPGSPRRAPVSP